MAQQVGIQKTGPVLPLQRVGPKKSLALESEEHLGNSQKWLDKTYWTRGSLHFLNENDLLASEPSEVTLHRWWANGAMRQLAA